MYYKSLTSMCVLYHSIKSNIVVDSLSRFLMGHVHHVDDEKKKLVHNVQKLAILGVCLVNLVKISVLEKNDSKSSLVVEVKEKKDSDSILLKLKGSSAKSRRFIVSPKGEMVYFSVKANYVFKM